MTTVRTVLDAWSRSDRTDTRTLDQVHEEGVATMGDKSPKKANAKKPGKTLKEKRAAKHEKNQPPRGLGAS
jgi:hypothetical protein